MDYVCWFLKSSSLLCFRSHFFSTTQGYFFPAILSCFASLTFPSSSDVSNSREACCYIARLKKRAFLESIFSSFYLSHFSFSIDINNHQKSVITQSFHLVLAPFFWSFQFYFIPCQLGFCLCHPTDKAVVSLTSWLHSKRGFLGAHLRQSEIPSKLGLSFRSITPGSYSLWVLFLIRCSWF